MTRLPTPTIWATPKESRLSYFLNFCSFLQSWWSICFNSKILLPWNNSVYLLDLIDHWSRIVPCMLNRGWCGLFIDEWDSKPCYQSIKIQSPIFHNLMHEIIIILSTCSIISFLLTLRSFTLWKNINWSRSLTSHVKV